MSSKSSFLQILVLLYVGSLLAKCNEFFVHPVNAADLCPKNTECHDLAYYTNQSDLVFTSNVIFTFMDGIHMLDERELLEIDSVSNVIFRGLGEIVPSSNGDLQSTVQIVCEDWTGGFFFIHSSNITLDTITIRDCGGMKLEYSLSLGFWDVSNLILFQVTVRNSSGIGLLVINGFDVLLNTSVLTFNNYDSYSDEECLYFRDDNLCSGGNALFLYIRSKDQCGTEQPIYSLTIINSNISYGVNLVSGGFWLTGGISILLKQGSAYGVDVILDNVILYKNIGMRGANIHFAAWTSVVYHTLTILNSIVAFGNLIDDLGYIINLEYETHFSSIGGGLLYDIGVQIDTEDNPCQMQPPNILLTIATTVFYTNYGTLGGGVAVFALSEEKKSIQKIVVYKCLFLHNIGLAGMGMYFERYEYLTYYTPVKYIFYGVLVNESIPLFSYAHPTFSAVFMFALEDTLFCDFQVTNHNTSGIIVINSVLTFACENNVLFNNHGVRGGGLTLYGGSVLVLEPPLLINMSNNSAEKGGAIYVEKSYGDFLEYCFFQINNIPANESKIVFENNNASDSGSVLYGGNVDACLLYKSSLLSNSTCTVLFDTIFDFDNQTGLSVISSEPIEVCFCEGNKPDCSRRNKTWPILPGNSVVMNLVAMGQRYGITPGIVRVAKESNEHTELEHLVYELPGQCSDQFYAVVPNSSNTTMINLTLTVNQRNNKVIDHFNENVKQIFINVEACPFGFELVDGVCECGKIIRSSKTIFINCYPNTEEIEREGEIWIAFDNSNQCIVVKSPCPFDYYNADVVNFSLTAPDAQCSLHRSGILCGQCADGLSLLLGSNKCDHCHNGYLALILPFAAAGIVLVVLLIVLNLTVSVGAINGLIFYANVIKINETVFFPNGSIPFLSQFIAWINLDLGIETCFFNGMDGYWKTWLQFAFPFYIWFLILVIIFICHYSVRLSQLVSDHVVSVLATLLLLSYTKLFRSVVTVLQRVVIPCGSDTLPVSWLIDPNIEYFTPRHLILFVFAIFVLVFLVLPYTLLLLLGPVLEKQLPKSRHLRSVFIKLKPILDSYNGPYKDKFRFWTGLVLLARLAIVLVATLSNDTETNITTVITTTAILLTLTTCCGGVYQKMYLNILESWFLLNLVILATFSLTQRDEDTVSKVSVCIAVFTFFIILLYHMVLRWKGQNFIDTCTHWSKYRDKSSSGATNRNQLEVQYLPSIHDTQCTHAELDIMERETMLMYDSEERIANTGYIRIKAD